MIRAVFDETRADHTDYTSQFRVELECFRDMDLQLPLDYAAIARILPHRYPFLLVDRITEIEQDKRIVGIKNVSLNERYLVHSPGHPPVLPPTVVKEECGRVGALL